MRPPRPAMFLITVTLLGAAVFSVIRFVLYLQNQELLAAGIDNDPYWVRRAMGVGFRFDLNLAFMLMLPAAIALTMGQFLGRQARWASLIALVWLVIGYSLSLIAQVCNIPYFTHFQAHINAMSMKYATTGAGDVTSLIFSETSYLVYAFPCI